MAAYVSHLSLPALLLLGIHLYFLPEDSVFVATFPNVMVRTHKESESDAIVQLSVHLFGDSDDTLHCHA